MFDMKMDFTHKGRWVLNRHKTPSLEGSTYAGVASQESARISFACPALNGVDAFVADIRHACFQVPISEYHHIMCGLKFGLENTRKIVIMRRVLCGIKASVRDFRDHLRLCVTHIDFKPCLSELHTWMRLEHKSDKNEHCEYLLCTEDNLVVSDNAEHVFRK